MSISLPTQHRQKFRPHSPRRRQRSLWQGTSKSIGSLSRSVDWLRWGKVSGVTMAIVALWTWQWEIVAATGVGVGVMSAIYVGYDLPWTKYLEEFYRFFQGESQRLLLSVGGGAIALGVSAGAIAFWQSTENHWLTTVIGGQSLMLAAILLISLRQMWSASGRLQEFDTALENLDHSSRIKRLSAIRYLRQQLQDKMLDEEQRQTLKIFLQLAWEQETEPVLRESLLDILSLQQSQQQRTDQPLRLGKKRPPIAVKSKTALHPLRQEQG